MNKFLLASHGYMANGILNAVQLIMGHVEDVHTLCAYIEGNHDIEQLVNHAITKMKEDSSKEWIVLTDIFGGSVNNAFMNKREDCSFHLVSGLNLGLVLDLLSKRHSKDTKEMIIQSLKDTNCMIQYCNDLTPSTSAEEDF